MQCNAMQCRCKDNDNGCGPERLEERPTFSEIVNPTQRVAARHSLGCMHGRGFVGLLRFHSLWQQMA